MHGDRKYRPGDQVLAALPVGLKLVTVVRALHGHILYEVSWSQTKRRILSFADISPL